jgi:hypothetical protein
MLSSLPDGRFSATTFLEFLFQAEVKKLADIDDERDGSVAQYRSTGDTR